MPYLPLTVSPSPTAPVPLSDPPVVGPTEVVAIVVVLGGIILACIAASLIKTLGGKALDKVKAADVPVVLRILATWINPFTGFLPSLRGRGTASTRQPASAEGMHHDHVQRQEPVMNDSTSDAAIGRIAAEQLIARMEQLEISQRALVFAYVGLDISLAALARELEITVAEARTRIQEGLMALRADEDLQLLAGISRAGDRADFHDHIQRLQLEAWFCRWCGGFQVQKGRGRPRLTCSERCRPRAVQDHPAGRGLTTGAG